MSKTPYIDQMDKLLSEKREGGMIGMRLFVDSSTDRTLEDMAHGFCAMETAEKNGKWTDISNDFL